MNTIDLVTAKIKLLSPEKQDQVLDFVEFLLSKHQPEDKEKSAEQRALERVKDLEDPDNPELWHTVVEIEQEVNIESSLKNLRKRGYKIQIPSKS